MNELHKAYSVLGLDAGSSMESVLRRYKRLIMVWHPDRAPTAEHKEFAEEELKKINNAKDVLAKHFGAGGGHKENNCVCQPNAATTSNASSEGSGRGGPGPGPAYHRTKTADDKSKEEEAARQRDAERRAREAAEAAAKQQQEYKTQTQTNTMESAMQQQKALQDEQLRWKISIGLVIAFVALEFFGAGAINAKNWWHDMTWKWQNQTSNSSPPPQSNTSTPTVTPYIPPYEQTPGGNPSSWAAEKAQRDTEREAEQKKKLDQDIYFAKLDIDKYQNIIEHCNSEITNLDIQLASSSVSDYEKNKLRETRDFRQKNLSEAQENLRYAQNKLAELTGQPAPNNTPSTLYQSPFTGSQTQKLFPAPSTSTSPFAPPADPNSLTKPNYLFPSKNSFDGLSKPLSTTPSFSELIKKNGTLTTPTTNSRFSDLLKTPSAPTSSSN